MEPTCKGLCSRLWAEGLDAAIHLGVAKSRMRSESFLRDRWRSPEGDRLAFEALTRLTDGRSLSTLPLSMHDGRVDLRGLVGPSPVIQSRTEIAGYLVDELGKLVTFKRVELDGLDLSGAFLPSFRFYDTSITNCRFDGAHC